MIQVLNPLRCEVQMTSYCILKRSDKVLLSVMFGEHLNVTIPLDVKDARRLARELIKRAKEASA